MWGKYSYTLLIHLGLGAPLYLAHEQYEAAVVGKG